MALVEGRRLEAERVEEGVPAAPLQRLSLRCGQERPPEPVTPPGFRYPEQVDVKPAPVRAAAHTADDRPPVVANEVSQGPVSIVSREPAIERGDAAAQNG